MLELQVFSFDQINTLGDELLFFICPTPTNRKKIIFIIYAKSYSDDGGVTKRK